jgi:hypothetical protein
MDETILEFICCPLGKAPLKYNDEFLECTKCGVRFPIKDNIPSLIIEEGILPEGVNSVSELSCQKQKS